MASGAADEEEMNNIIVPGLRVGKYTFDMSKDDVLDNLGKPETIFYGEERYTLDNLPRMYYMCFDDISFRIVDDSVKEIGVHSRLYKFTDGLGVGDSEQKIKQAFGDDFHFEETEWKDFLIYEDQYLQFEISKKDRTVMEFSVYPDKSLRFHKKAHIPATSIIDEQGHIVDKIDYPFVNDPQVIGTWEAIDFVGEIEDFKINEKQLEGKGGKLFLHGMIFVKNGRLISKNDKVPRGYRGIWTNGLVIYNNDTKTASKYTFKDIDGSTYMFYEWKSGDYTFRHRKPSYYVLKKISSETDGLAGVWASQPSDAEFARQLPAKIEQLDIDTANLEQVKEIFGKPAQYIWESESFEEDNLPNRYIMIYPAGFSVFMFKGQIREIRFRRPGYVFNSAIQVGSTLDEVIANVGEPEETITGKKIEFKRNVLYKNIEGEKGYCYYHRSDKSVRMFFKNHKVIALFVTRTEEQNPADNELKKESFGATDEKLVSGNQKQRLQGLVEDFFKNNYRDITSRKTVEWGEPVIDTNGNMSISYKYEMIIWDKDKFMANQLFTFDKDGKYLNVKKVEGFPKPLGSVEIPAEDVSTKESVQKLVEKFFSRNYRDITARKTIEWGDLKRAENGNVSLRYKYEATIWGKKKIVHDKIFTFDKDGQFVSVKDVT